VVVGSGSKLISRMTPRRGALAYLSLLLCSGFAAVLVAFYIYSIFPYLMLPADILMFSESNFVGDIMKLRSGVPIYTPPADNNSLHYTPGAQVLTYAIAWSAGATDSIPTLRIIQVGFAFLAAVVAAVCSRLLFRIAFPGETLPYPRTWFVFSVFVLFLAATAPRTSRFAHCLHADSLAMLVSTFCFLSMLLFSTRETKGRLALIAVLPSVGFMVKQFLLGWIAVYATFLVTDAPKRWGRVVVFIGCAGMTFLLTLGICYALWGDAFWFWVFEVVGGRRRSIGFSAGAYEMSIPRAVDHLLRAWWEIAIGVVGGWLIMKYSDVARVKALWVSWVGLIGLEALTSGVGWGVLYHFGPGVVIGTAWLLAAVSRIWLVEQILESPARTFLSALPRQIFAIAGIVSLFIALHVIPTGDRLEPRYWQARPPMSDVYRYISEIQREVDAGPIDKVLLDVGNWVYFKHAHLAKDRATAIADQPPVGIYDNISAMVQRINSRAYDKLLLRNFHSEYFLYDWDDWPRPSGVKRAILANYEEVRTIAAPVELQMLKRNIYYTGPVSVFVAKSLTNGKVNGH